MTIVEQTEPNPIIIKSVILCKHNHRDSKWQHLKPFSQMKQIDKFYSNNIKYQPRMIKGVLIGLTLLFAANSIIMHHEDSEEGAIDVNSLSDEQKGADAFFRKSVPNLAGAKLVKYHQDDKYFKYQYISQNAPLTMTQVSADRWTSDPLKFKLLETVQSFSGPLENGRMTSSVKTYGIQSFEKARENLEWN